MKITKQSTLTGKVNAIDLPVTEKQLERYSLNAGCVQDIFPELCMGLREYIKSGITPREWKSNFGCCGDGNCHKTCIHFKKKGNK